MTDVNIRSLILISAQFLWLVMLLLTGRFLLLDNVPILLVQAAAIALGLWAIGTVGLSRVRVQPDVHPEASLVTSGPYAKIRHPMYTSLIIFTAAAIVADFTALRLGIWLALVVTMLVKLHYEEGLLDRHFPDYEKYRATTWRIIPWIY